MFGICVFEHYNYLLTYNLVFWFITKFNNDIVKIYKIMIWLECVLLIIMGYLLYIYLVLIIIIKFKLI